jgi:hypothetical protein
MKDAFLKALPDLKLLGRLTLMAGPELRIRGSLAARLAAASEDEAMVGSGSWSMFDFARPFTDIDLVVAPKGRTAAVLQGLIEKHLPLSRFFRFEFSHYDEQEWYRKHSNLHVKGETEIRFTQDGTPEFRKETAEIEISLNRPDRFNRVGALRDLVYVAQRYPDVLSKDHEAVDGLVGRIKTVGGRGIRTTIEANRAESFRVQMELVKYILGREERALRAHDNDQPSPGNELAAVLGRYFCKQFITGERTKIVDLFLLAVSAPVGKPCTFVVLPRYRNRSFSHLDLSYELSETAEQEDKLAELLTSTGSKELADDEHLLMSPVSSAAVDEPPDPECCRYEDFWRGVIEAGWFDPEFGRYISEQQGSSNRVKSLSSMVSPRQPEFESRTTHQAHSVATFGPIGGVRLDYGHLCVLSKSGGVVDFVAMGSRAEGHTVEWPKHQPIANNPHPKDVVKLVHGIFSSEEKLATAAKLLGDVPNRVWEVTCQGVNWKVPVLHQGIDFAWQLVEDLASWRRLVLVGHSQGGLVCRVAAAALCHPDELRHAIECQANVLDDSFSDTALINLEKIRTLKGREQLAEKLVGVATVATPNSGAFTGGQLSLITDMVKEIMQRGAAHVGGADNFEDLTSGRLQGVLQHVRVERVLYLSISGSYYNRIDHRRKKGSRPAPVNRVFDVLGTVADAAEGLAVPVLSGIAKLAPRLDFPNDGIVEDASVDLTQSVYAPEIADLDSQYRHIRLYPGNTEAVHTEICEHSVVIDLLREQFSKWFAVRSVAP